MFGFKKVVNGMTGESYDIVKASLLEDLNTDEESENNYEIVLRDTEDKCFLAPIFVTVHNNGVFADLTILNKTYSQFNSRIVGDTLYFNIPDEDTNKVMSECNINIQAFTDDGDWTNHSTQDINILISLLESIAKGSKHKAIKLTGSIFVK